MEESGEGTARVAAMRDESFDVAEELVRSLPNNPHALCLLGSVHQRFGNEQTAAKLWHECLRLNPRFADAHLAFGQAALKEGDFAAAESHLRSALRIDPAWADVPLPLAKALVGQGKFREAAEVLETFVASHPASVEAWCRLGQAYQGLGDYDDAERCHREALTLHPQSADAAYGIAVAHQKLGEHQQAKEYFDKFAQLRSGEQDSLRREQPRLSDAQRMSDTLADTHMTACRVALLHGLVAEAQQHARRAAEIDPQHGESRQTLCDIHARTGRLDEAIAAARELCDLYPEAPEKWHRLGLLNLQKQQPAEAEAAFRRVIELAPEQAAGYAALAQVQMLEGRDRQEAVQLARRAVELVPTADHHHLLATACWNVGDVAGARAELEEALRLDPANPRYRRDYARLRQPSSSP